MWWGSLFAPFSSESRWKTPSLLWHGESSEDLLVLPGAWAEGRCLKWVYQLSFDLTQCLKRFASVPWSPCAGECPLKFIFLDVPRLGMGGLREGRVSWRWNSHGGLVHLCLSEYVPKAPNWFPWEQGVTKWSCILWVASSGEDSLPFHFHLGVMGLWLSTEVGAPSWTFANP